MEALPTRLGLSRRLQHLSLECSICGAAVESSLHALLNYCLARGIWEENGSDFESPRGCIDCSLVEIHIPVNVVNEC